MNEIKAWLVEQGYELVGELIATDGSWVLQLQFGKVSLPVILVARDVEEPRRGIAAIESLFKALLD